MDPFGGFYPMRIPTSENPTQRLVCEHEFGYEVFGPKPFFRILLFKNSGLTNFVNPFKKCYLNKTYSTIIHDKTSIIYDT